MSQSIKNITAKSWKIKISGVVQGVGFRPFIYKLAHKLQLNGWVQNNSEGVLIAVYCSQALLDQFITQIKRQAPPLSKIDDIYAYEAEPQQYQDKFYIQKSRDTGSTTTIVPTDSYVCEDCLREMNDPQDRRYKYPFINCTNCGPRFSLIQNIPYDRAQTTMKKFEMCPKCSEEYHNPLNRRYHAQPNACPVCGPHLEFVFPDGRKVKKEEALEKALQALRDGLILAVKSVGGFHLVIDACNEKAVARLRERKKRQAKPFALMSKDIDTISKYTQITEVEKKLLLSTARPIVLLKKANHLLPENLAPNNPSLGFMLPSAPLHYLLLEACDVLVMTSGNVSGYPIEYTNEGARERLFNVADYILDNNRDIEMRIDDSVIRCTDASELKDPIVSYIRKARGYAPYPIQLDRPIPLPIIGYGAELKTTIAVSKSDVVYVSQHIGDLKNEETASSHQLIASHLCKLYNISPEYIVCDLHPLFVSFAVAKQHENIAIDQVQHHHAHMASCMADNNLSGKTLGVIFDGTGYGEDKTIWGAEFLYGDYSGFTRVASIRHIPLLGGDKAVNEPLRTAFALVYQSTQSMEVFDVLPAFKELEAMDKLVFQRMLIKEINTYKTSSMGRFFDGVASLVGLCRYAEYEAQGPIELEGLLNRDLHMLEPYPFTYDQADGKGYLEMDYGPIIRAIMSDIKNKVDIKVISRRFHSTIVTMIVEICKYLSKYYAFNQIVLSGGVFLNEFLLVNTMIELPKVGLKSYCHQNIPTNDAGISLGQIMVCNARHCQ